MRIGLVKTVKGQTCFSCVVVEVTVPLETDSTSASGICRRRGVGRLRHLHKKELWLQDHVAAKTGAI